MPGSRSIVVVLGDLRLAKLVFADDVLVVSGRLHTTKALRLPGRSEGILMVAGESLLGR